MSKTSTRSAKRVITDVKSFVKCRIGGRLVGTKREEKSASSSQSEHVGELNHFFLLKVR